MELAANSYFKSCRINVNKSTSHAIPYEPPKPPTFCTYVLQLSPTRTPPLYTCTAVTVQAMQSRGLTGLHRTTCVRKQTLHACTRTVPQSHMGVSNTSNKAPTCPNLVSPSPSGPILVPSPMQIGHADTGMGVRPGTWYAGTATPVITRALHHLLSDENQVHKGGVYRQAHARHGAGQQAHGHQHEQHCFPLWLGTKYSQTMRSANPIAYHGFKRSNLKVANHYVAHRKGHISLSKRAVHDESISLQQRRTVYNETSSSPTVPPSPVTARFLSGSFPSR